MDFVSRQATRPLTVLFVRRWARCAVFGAKGAISKLEGTGISWLMEATRAQTVLVARQAKSCEPETRNQSVPYAET